MGLVQAVEVAEKVEGVDEGDAHKHYLGAARIRHALLCMQRLIGCLATHPGCDRCLSDGSKNVSARSKLLARRSTCVLACLEQRLLEQVAAH